MESFYEYPLPPDEQPPSIGAQWVAQAELALTAVRIPEDVRQFASVMDDIGDFDVFDFFEKPWKWAREMAVWLAAGKPTEEEATQEQWDGFVARLEVAS